MGRRGPAPTPTAILEMRGSGLMSQRRQKEEAKGPPGPPECPEWLNDEARAVWDQLVPMLEAMRVLSRIDVNALARYCHTWVRWRKAEEFIAKHGEMFVTKDEKGEVKYCQQWPQVAVAHKLSLVLIRLEQEFGMTPSARTRIQIPPIREPSPKDRYFKSPKVY